MKETPPAPGAVRMYLPLFKEVGREVVTPEHLVPEKNYVLPFPDRYFKFVVSPQTFERVFRGVHLEFCQKVYVQLSESRPTRIVNAARRAKLGWAASAVVERMCQRAMVIRKGGSSVPCS